jgi:hypothetical protein
MPNNLNLLLSSFFSPLSSTGSTPLTGREGIDYVIDGKNLFFPLSSSLLTNTTKVQSFSPNISSFYGNKFGALTAIEIGAPNITNFSSSTNLRFISASNIGLSALTLSGGNYEFFGIFVSPTLRSVSLLSLTAGVGAIFTCHSNSNLSSISVNSTSLQGLSACYLFNNNLTNSTIDTFFTVLSGNYRNHNSLGGLYVGLSNPVTGTAIAQSIFDSFRSKSASINISRT